MTPAFSDALQVLLHQFFCVSEKSSFPLLFFCSLNSNNRTVSAEIFTDGIDACWDSFISHVWYSTILSLSFYNTLLSWPRSPCLYLPCVLCLRQNDPWGLCFLLFVHIHFCLHVTILCVCFSIVFLNVVCIPLCSRSLFSIFRYISMDSLQVDFLFYSFTSWIHFIHHWHVTHHYSRFSMDLIRPEYFIGSLQDIGLFTCFTESSFQIGNNRFTDDSGMHLIVTMMIIRMSYSMFSSYVCYGDSG